MKGLFGGKLHSHSFENQKIEALLYCNILNRFTQLGMPVSTSVNRESKIRPFVVIYATTPY